jgi:uncharacterized protein YdaU (DUF1376 family)
VAEVPAVAPLYLFMATNPVFPLYYNDIDRSTRDWTDEEFGCYMRLLIHQWAQGELPKEPERLQRITTSLVTSWLKVGKKFVETDTGLVNTRLEEIRAERLAFSQKQSQNRQKRTERNKIQPVVNQNSTKTLPKVNLHIEDEDEDKKQIEGVKGERLTEMEIGGTREYIAITGQRKLTSEQIEEYWKAYLIHSTGIVHVNRTRQLQHFRNWLKLQPHEKSKNRTAKDPSKPGAVRTAI